MAREFTRRSFGAGALKAVGLGAVGPLAGTAAFAQGAAGPIRIGEINSYTAMSAFTAPYRKGIELAVEQINAGGGVIGRPLEVIFRDDNFRPADAVRVANELVLNEKVDILAGAFSSGVGLALSEFASRNRKVYIASEPLTDSLVWDKGSRYVFRIRNSIHMLCSMMVEEAAKLPAKRWATIAQNFEGGIAFVKGFKELLSAKRPDITWVAEQWPAMGKLEAGPTADALEAAKPEAIFVDLIGPDLLRFVREGNTRGLFKDRSIVAAVAGEPEFLDPLKEETPEGWFVTGYAWQDNTPSHAAFRTAYENKYKDYPRFGSLVGYTTMQAIRAGIARAGSLDTEKLIAGFKGLEFDAPTGKIKIRAADHQATMGAWVGWLSQKDGKGFMKDWKYLDGTAYLPSEAEAAKLRPASENQ